MCDRDNMVHCGDESVSPHLSSFHFREQFLSVLKGGTADGTNYATADACINALSYTDRVCHQNVRFRWVPLVFRRWARPHVTRLSRHWLCAVGSSSVSLHLRWWISSAVKLSTSEAGITTSPLECSWPTASSTLWSTPPSTVSSSMASELYSRKWTWYSSRSSNFQPSPEMIQTLCGPPTKRQRHKSPPYNCPLKNLLTFITSYRRILPSTQSFAAFLWPVYPARSQDKTDFGRRVFSSAFHNSIYRDPFALQHNRVKR